MVYKIPFFGGDGFFSESNIRFLEKITNKEVEVKYFLGDVKGNLNSQSIELAKTCGFYFLDNMFVSDYGHYPEIATGTIRKINEIDSQIKPILISPTNYLSEFSNVLFIPFSGNPEIPKEEVESGKKILLEFRLF